MKKQYGINIKEIDYTLQKELPNILRTNSSSKHVFNKVNIAIWGQKHLMDIETAEDTPTYGLALDIGTTTIATYLVNLETGRTETIESTLNPTNRIRRRLYVKNQLNFAKQKR